MNIQDDIPESPEDLEKIINPKSLNKDLEMYKFKVCTKCQVIQNPLSYHCKTCGHCVQIYDHHSAFLNQCIGEGNYKPYLKLHLWGMFMILAYQVSFIMLFLIESDAYSWNLFAVSNILAVLFSLIAFKNIHFFIICCIFLILGAFHIFALKSILLEIGYLGFLLCI